MDDSSNNSSISKKEENTMSEDLRKLQKIDEMYENFLRGASLTVPEVTVDELDDMLLNSRNKVVLVDVREPEEQQLSIIPRAMTKAEFEEQVKSGSLDLDQVIVVPYCTIGYRSALYINELKKKGLQSEIYNLRGSILAWSHKHPVVNPQTNEPTVDIHTYGKIWSLAPSGYHCHWFSAPERLIKEAKYTLSYIVTGRTTL